MKDKIFALDIGTRKIAGLVMQKTAQGYEVLASELIEHNSRSMLDGQIHDVEAVAASIQKIKEKLENRLDISLKTAAVAAAGRALKTANGSADKSRSFKNEISSEEVRALEIEAIQEAQYMLAHEELGSNESSNYFCVGYSVVSYYLEDQAIINLVGQVGKKISVEVIATFLPRVVVDGLFSALKKAGLEVFSMTLEPIAALSVTIPPNMRLLNLALVDIGAGTSDIAIVKEGNIYGYAMVPIGGDELTEHLAEEYLLDFNTAEEVKCRLLAEERLSFVDVLGNELELEASEIQVKMDSLIRELAIQISRSIVEINQKPPAAILCVGGGSLTPGLVKHLADALEMPPKRVGVRSRESLKNISGDLDKLAGPQGVTPLGIAHNSFNKEPIPFVKMNVNGREVAVWNMGEIDVASALLNSGIGLNNIYGKPGMGKTIEVNGVLKLFKGEMGTAPLIKINGKEATLDSPVINGDNIEFEKGRNGRDAIIRLDELDPGSAGYIYVNGEKMQVKPRLLVNGKESSLSGDIPDRAVVELKRADYLRDILLNAGVEEYLLQENNYNYFLNGKAMFLKWSPVKIKLDGRDAELSSILNFGASVEYKILSQKPRIKDVINTDAKIDLTVTVNGQKVILKGHSCIIKINEQVVDSDTELFNGARINVEAKAATAILSDIFQVVDIKPVYGGSLEIRVDGQKAGYTTPIYNGSEIELEWI